ncbi:MAG TPA: SDR family NAD(P)-dependent oxidoreductase [Thermomicrobiaceae bacterium]|nr:SDR family NAD(P)-dependent oxidoreductase [Thermomicrobiaceae bacterium]
MGQLGHGRVDLTQRLVGDVAIVTGGSQGIGRVVADRLAAEGAAVAILARTEGTVRAAADELAAAGAEALGVPCDVTDRAQVRAAVERVIERFGRLSILVNHAGVFRHAPFADVSDEMWNELLHVNLTGMFIVAQEVAREMIRLGAGGRIVNMSSAAAHMAHSDQMVYGVTKAGIEAMTRAMAFDLAPYGIVVNAVAPGTIQTSFSVGNLSREAVDERVRRIPLGRLGDPAEVAAVIAMLASPDASYVTGVVIPIDGGLITAGVRAPSA